LDFIRHREGAAGRSKRGLVYNRFILASLIALFVGILYLNAVTYIPQLKSAKARFGDYLFKARHLVLENFFPEMLGSEYIVLVTMDEETYLKMRTRWPWTRDIWADFINKLSEYKPRTTALDFALYGETTGNPGADLKLAKAIKDASNVILASSYGSSALYLGPLKIFKDAAYAEGVAGARRDSDLTLRKTKAFLLILSTFKSADASFAVKTAAHYLGIPKVATRYKNDTRQPLEGIIKEAGAVRLSSFGNKDIVLPIDEEGDILINYINRIDDFTTVSVWRIMNGDVDRSVLEDKLVVISPTGDFFHDIHSTPLGRMAGGVMLCNTIDSVIRQNHIKKANPIISASVAALIYVALFFLFHKMRPASGFLVLAAAVAGYLILALLVFMKGLILPTFFSVSLLPALFIGITFSKYANMLVESAEIKRMAITDSLTDLYTHRYFNFLLEHTAEDSVGRKRNCSLIIIKLINVDRIVKDISFDMGQNVQKALADLIRIKLPAGGYASYLGMGEFAMIMPAVGIDEALGIAGSLRYRIISEDYGIEEKRLLPRVTMGVSYLSFTSYPKTGAEMMRSARAAMLRARDIGNNKICRFNPKIDVSVFETDYAEREIKQKIDDEFGFLAVDLEERNRELEDLLRELSSTQKELEQAHFETLKSLVVAIEEKDPCTAGHSERVGMYAEKVGTALKMSEEEVRLLRQAGDLHDIGKVGIPQDILRKEKGLTPAERHVIELHPEFSVKILSTSRYFNKILPAIRDHHERLDGSGYPRALSGQDISLQAQIIMICDVFDAMTTDRPYRKALTHQEGLAELMSHPEKYNRKVVNALQSIIAPKQEKDGAVRKR